MMIKLLLSEYSNEIMENIHHIHEVLNILYSSDEVFTIEGLHHKIKSQFGDTVQFTSCSNNVFPPEEVVPFLLSRQKIRLEENNIVPLTPACSH